MCDLCERVFYRLRNKIYLKFCVRHCVLCGQTNIVVTGPSPRRLHYHAHKPEKTTEEFSKKFIHRSGWTPPWTSLTDQTRSTITRITQETDKIINPISLGSGTYRQIRNRHNGNLSNSELSALRELKLNNDIVIKPADKGGAIVVMDRSLYVAEGERQLHNTT